MVALSIPSHHDLFGPLPGTGNEYTYTPGTEYAPLSAFTASRKDFRFDYPTAKIEYANFLIVWTPQAVHRVRLRWNYSGPSELIFTDMGEIIPAEPGLLRPSGLNITAALRAAQLAGHYSHVGFDVKGDGVTPLTLYSAWLSVHWRVGYHGS